MNILFVTKQLPYPPNAGYKMRTYQLIRGLSGENKVSLICMGSVEEDKESVEALKEYVNSVTLIPSKQTPSRLLNLLSPAPFNISRWRSALMRKAAGEIIQKEQIDLIICDSIYQSGNIPSNSCCKVLAEHNVESVIIRRFTGLEKNILKKAYALLEWLKMRRYEDKTWPEFNKCLVVSEQDRAILEVRMRSNNIDIVPNGVDTGYFYPQQTGIKPLSLIYTGEIGWHPNTDAVIYFAREIFPLIKKKVADASFYVVGNNPSSEVLKLAEKDKSIIVTGFVEDIRSYIAQSEVFVVPLRIGSGTRLKILEAMAMGKPVVSTSIGCEGIGVSHGKNIIVADGPEEFTDKVIELFNNQELKAKLALSARKLVEEKYSWTKITQELNSVIRQLQRNLGTRENYVADNNT